MGKLISEKYAAWQAECEARFQQLKKNEEELNRIFIDIYGLQDELTPDVADEVLGNYTDVAEAERFVKETGVSALAVMVGTAHGRYKKAPVLDIQRIRDIREATGKLPLVLHGGSGVPDEQIRMAVEAGIRKVNFATDLCYAFLDQVMVTERTTVALDVFMREPIHAIRDYCISKIRLLGADRL